VGDRLLQEIARRLRAAVVCTDSLSRRARGHTTARLGGDEFVVLLDGLAGPGDAIAVADRLLETLAQPYDVGEHKVYTTASIGIVTSAISADGASDVLRDADTAMYEAKLAGRGQHVVFDVAMRERVQNRLHLETDLRKALAANQLFLMYQPIVSLQTGRIEGFEALVRWQHPQRGLISPAEFIPIAEDTGLILPIGEWVLREACAQFVRWRRSMGPDAPRNISVNLSRNQLVLPDLADRVRRILEQTGMTPGNLHLEVTESAVMKDAEAAAGVLRTLKAIGVKVDMDDFGTGYSSLACLHQFPLDVLKIDRSFVANLDRGRDFAALVHAVTQLARNLNIGVVAEGIETINQTLILQSLECEFGQGYLFSKPMMPDRVVGFRVRPAVLPGQAA
jgi:diguanylate cyclase (GGDEF)-like protein